MKITNLLTLLRLIAAVLFLIIFNNINALEAKMISLLLLIFAQVSDYLDGHIARTRNQITNPGKVYVLLAGWEDPFIVHARYR
jgi:CDP-diacylglycerol--glycerol-3-phosphate 3-phosphatidyltransferase